MNEYGIDDIPAVTPQDKDTGFSPFGRQITADEVSDRLSENLYRQLSDNSEKFVLDAVARAEVYIGTLLAWKRTSFNLDNRTIREIVLMQTLYELHMALGHEEAGREFRTQMKNTFIAAFGSFPDSDNSGKVEQTPAAQVVVPPNPNHIKYQRARRFSS
ncbi:MAG: hypothetical protein UHO11_02430 [Treponema sp.]|nr:hypothetical protein [Treponema sp.]